ncbi:MAG TPA: LacI family DNA-binding transcriptional regulator [Spirochaetia bacterium]|nr:LacI family DNA-binding transcriptional regulator [Spirochaetia bacterium]
MSISDERQLLDADELADILNSDPKSIEKIYQDWLSGKRSKANLKPDLRLVALLTGLSTASVSYFLNGKKNRVSRDTSEKVQKVLKSIGFTPTIAARKLRSKEKKSIAFVSALSDSPSPEFSLALLKAVKDEAKKYGYYVDIFDVTEGEERDFFANPPFLGMVDGVILSSITIDHEGLAPLIEHKIPVVDFHSWEKLDRAPVTNSITPRAEVMSELLAHLFGECGYRNPVLVSVPVKNNHTRRRKLELFKFALQEFDIPFDVKKNLVLVEKYSIAESKRALPEIFRRNPNVDAIVCLSEVTAMTVMEELAASGRRVAVTGYDNLEISELFNITTIDQNLTETGRMAFEKLYYAIRYVRENGTFPEYQEAFMDSTYVQRSSSLPDKAFS